MKDNEDVLNLKFRICDNVEYKIDDNGRVTIFEKQDHRIQSFFRKLKFRIPLYKEIEFDEISSAVFLDIDGNKTVKQIGEDLVKRFGDKVEPLYERLLIFINHIYINCKYIEKQDATLYRKNIKMVSYLKACHFLVGICKNYSIYGKNY